MSDHFEGIRQYFQTAKTYNELPGALHKAKLSDEDFARLDDERVAFHDNEENQFMSLFRHIRCAFAHGRVGMKKTDQRIIYLMENGSIYRWGFKVNARMVLKKSTLLSWVQIIREGPKEEENDYYEEVLELFKENPKRTIKSICAELAETRYAVERAIRYWKKRKILSFDGRGRHGRWVIDYALLQSYQARNRTPKQSFLV